MIEPIKTKIKSPKINSTEAAFSKAKVSNSNKNIGGRMMNMSSGLQKGIGAAGNMLGSFSGSNLEEDQKQTREGIRSAIGQFGPIGAAISLVSSIVDTAGDITGLNLDNIDKNAAKRAGIGGAGLNNFMNVLPGNSMVWGSMVGKTDEANKSQEIDKLRGGYGGSANDIDSAIALGDKRFLFGKKKANQFIAKQNQANKDLTNIGITNNLLKQNTYGDTAVMNNYNKYNGTNSTISLAKNGMKFLDDSRNILIKYKIEVKEPEIKPDISSFQDGGKLNIIVDGSLHARNHNLDLLNPDLEDVTPKGIPVITVEENSEKLTQIAEVEVGELIFTKEITDKLEELYKDGSDEAMIKAGKLLSEEIIEYTEDKTEELLENENKD